MRRTGACFRIVVARERPELLRDGGTCATNALIDQESTHSLAVISIHATVYQIHDS